MALTNSRDNRLERMFCLGPLNSGPCAAWAGRSTQCWSPRARLTCGSKQAIFRLVHPGEQPEKDALHLVPILIAPKNRFGGIGIVLVIRRVVVMRDRTNTRPLWKQYGLLELIPDLPVEIPHTFEDRFRFARRVNQADLIILAAQVQVRLNVNQLGRIHPDRNLAYDFRVAVARGNGQVKRRWRTR